MRNVNQILEHKGSGSVVAVPREAPVLEVIRLMAENHIGSVLVMQGDELVSVLPTDTAQTCMQIMTARKIRHLPVLDEGRVVGLVSIGDLVKAVIEDQQQEIAQLQQYIAS
jgi:CBS domain-containing protein